MLVPLPPEDELVRDGCMVVDGVQHRCAVAPAEPIAEFKKRLRETLRILFACRPPVKPVGIRPVPIGAKAQVMDKGGVEKAAFGSLLELVRPYR
ncbi:hypothetical protein D9M72_621880 [compost metagenome]